MTADIQTFVDEIAARAKVDPDAAETAVERFCLLFNKKAMRPRWLSSSGSSQARRSLPRSIKSLLGREAGFSERSAASRKR